MTVELKDFTSFSNFIRDINSEKYLTRKEQEDLYYRLAKHYFND